MNINDIIDKPFDEENFNKFVKDTLGLTYTDIEQSFKPIGDGLSFKKTTEDELLDKSEITIFILQRDKDISRARVMFNKNLKKLTNNATQDLGLMVVYDRNNPSIWKLSLVVFEKNKLQTNSKRFTFELGVDVPKKTARAQLEKLNKNSTKQDYLEAFSVEKLSNAFFREYKELYHELVEDILVVVKKEKERAEIQQDSYKIIEDTPKIKAYIKKMLGRIVFLYFVQKKGWLDNEKKFLSKLFNDYIEKYPEENFNFYDKVLEQLFIKGLNQEGAIWRAFDGVEYKIPYLNGGLFDEDTEDALDISIPNLDMQKVFKLFDSYNFTIIEDSPTDSEVAIDPEMLGRIFEDLLEDRKDKGAFYTPREIVHYMCKQSIENYLQNEVKEYSYVFDKTEFLKRTALPDRDMLETYEKHPIKFIKIENYFTKFAPYKNLVVDFWIVAKLRGFRLDNKSQRVKTDNGHVEITSAIWKKILYKKYEVIDISFGSNKEIKLSNKSYTYPTLLKYIKIESKYFTLAFLPNIWGDLELLTVFPIRERNIRSKLRNFHKPLEKINEERFAFNEEVFDKIKEIQEDCRSLHPEPLQKEAELPRQAVIQKGLSTFYNSFNIESIADSNLKEFLTDKDYYNKTINKLLNNTNMSQTKLKDIMNHRLKKIKILDPAIGSGAFPMGMLHEILQTRVILGDKTPLAKLKREIIQNSIYGIDIEPSAVEIAKLRFWLSIVVDEEKPTPLPNLFYKIMVGNSLLETIEGLDPLKQHGNKKGMKFLKDKLHKFFEIKDHIEKKKIKKDIQHYILEVFQSAIKSLNTNPKLEMNKKEQQEQKDSVEKKRLLQEIIKDYNKKEYTTNLFLYKIYFKEILDEGGFDVVIGNPPYVRQEKIKELKALKEIQNFKSYNGTADLYIYFFEKGFNLLKPNGVLSYITSNKYTRAKYGKDFRNFLLENTEILTYIDFHNVKVFKSATTDTSILSFKKSTNKNTNFVYCDINNSYKKNNELEQFINEQGFKYQQNDLQGDSFSFANPEELKIKKKIEKIGIPLKKWNVEINRGILTGFNEAFVIDGKIKEKLIQEDAKSTEIIKPLLRGRDIKRYAYEFADKWLINLHNNPPLDIKNYPAIKKHLDKYYDKLAKRSDKGKTPYNLRNCAFLDEFEKEKIIWLELSDKNKFTIENKFYPLAGAFLMNGENLKYLLAFLNSKVIGWHFPFICNSSGVGTNQWKKVFVENLCIPKVSKEKQKPFEILVDYILFSKEKKMKDESSYFESIIDNMVYDLYFEEEMKKADCFISEEVEDIVEPWTKTTSDDVKKQFVSLAYGALQENKTIQRGLIYSKTVPAVKIINGEEK